MLLAVSQIAALNVFTYSYFRKTWGFQKVNSLEAHLFAEVGTISVIAITLRYVFELLHNASYLWRIVIASDSYRFRLFVGVIA